MRSLDLQIAILGVLDAQGEKAGAELYLALRKRLKKNVALAAIFVELERLEDDGWVKSDLRVDSKSQKERRYFRITDEGRGRRVELAQGANSEASPDRPIGAAQPKPAQSSLSL